MAVTVQEFNDYMWKIKEPSKVKEIQVCPQLFYKIHRGCLGASDTTEQKLQFSFMPGVEVPIIKDYTVAHTKNAGGFRVILHEEMELGNVAIIKLVNMRINGVVFEDMNGLLSIRTEQIDIGMGAYAPSNMVRGQSEHSMELLPDTNKDVSLIVFGLLMAISHNNDHGAHKITISGVDVDKPWLTYTGEYYVTEWKVASHAHRRVEHVGLDGRGSLNIVTDPYKEPKLYTSFSVEDVRILMTALNKSKGSFDTDKHDKAKVMLKQLRSLLEGKK